MIQVKYNLYYFNSNGRAATIRLMLAYLGIEYNDIRIEYPMNEAIKEKFPFGQVPYFEVEESSDETSFGLSQSLAIEHFIAHKYRIGGENLYERALMESYVHATRDVVNPYYLVKSDDAAILKYKEEIAPKFLKRFEQLVKNKKGLYLFGDRICWADLSIFNLIDIFYHQNMSSCLDNFQSLRLFYNQISIIPSISNYLQLRPRTKF